MASPVQLSDLDPATLAQSNDSSAVLLMRVGLTDYQVAVNIIRTLNLSILNAIPTPIQTDLMFLQRGTGNYSCTFGQVGFPTGTKLWFYNALPPSPNWGIVPNTGGNLLAVNDTVTKYAGEGSPGVVAGTWQQNNAILTIDQIPAHAHTTDVQQNVDGSRGPNFAGNTLQTNKNQGITRFTGGAGSTNQQGFPNAATNGHNHGNTWRPLANVGIIGEKLF